MGGDTDLSLHAHPRASPYRFVTGSILRTAVDGERDERERGMEIPEGRTRDTHRLEALDHLNEGLILIPKTMKMPYLLTTRVP